MLGAADYSQVSDSHKHLFMRRIGREVIGAQMLFLQCVAEWNWQPLGGAGDKMTDAASIRPISSAGPCTAVRDRRAPGYCGTTGGASSDEKSSCTAGVGCGPAGVGCGSYRESVCGAA